MRGADAPGDQDCGRQADGAALAHTPGAPVPPQKISLGTDGLFRFGGGSAADLQPEGRQKIELLTQEIRRNFASVQSIAIT